MVSFTGSTMRPLSEEDFEAAHALLALDEEHAMGRPSRIEVSDLRAWLDNVDLAQDTWLLEEDGRLIAFGWHEGNGALGFAIGVVHPETRGRGIGGTLVETAVRRARGAGGTRLHYGTLAADAGAPALLGAHGFREVRRFYEMAIELAEPPTAPALPDGLVIETFRVEDARPFYLALDESFRDHWEYHERAFEEWWEQRSGAPDFDPSLWFLIRDGEEVAAVVRNEPNRNGSGWVGALGVRRPWRGRGLGRALLLHTFAELYRRGMTRVSLGVDSENPTGASKLYESVGMAVEVEQVVFEKALA
ncbi:MAG: GNAT family N-acetyltransferase [Gaiellaceae bacterium]